MKRTLITENDVCDAVARWLTTRGLELEEPPRRTDQRGVDIVAKGFGERWFIEAKGETSSKPSSAKYEKGFTNGQLQIHVARAFYTAAKLRCGRPDEYTRVLMALPATDASKSAVSHIKDALLKLRIDVLWVAMLSGAGTLSVEPWPEGRFE